MPVLFEFADSEVAPIAGVPPSADLSAALIVSLGFAAACLFDASEGIEQRTGHARGLRLVLQGLLQSPPPAVLAEALGRLREGAVYCEGQWLRRLPLDWCSSGPVRLELLFANGVALQFEAARAHLERGAGFAVFESLAC